MERGTGPLENTGVIVNKQSFVREVVPAINAALDTHGSVVVEDFTVEQSLADKSSREFDYQTFVADRQHKRLLSSVNNHYRSQRSQYQITSRACTFWVKHPLTGQYRWIREYKIVVSLREQV